MINAAGLDMIKRFEGFSEEAYRDTAGILTIGYGTTAAAGVGITPKAGMRITEEEAERYLLAAIAKTEAAIGPFLKAPNDNQRGAMVSLAYNIGAGAFNRSTVLRRFNAGDVVGAAEAFAMWNKAGGAVVRGLVRRREAERSLFLTPPVAAKAVAAREWPQSVVNAPERPGLLSRIFNALFG